MKYIHMARSGLCVKTKEIRSYGNMLTYQIVIEPKGKYFKEHDKWKQDFLKEITDKFKVKALEFKTKRKTRKYRLVG